LAIAHRENADDMIVPGRDECLAIPGDADRRDNRWAADDRVFGDANHARGGDLKRRVAQDGRIERPERHANERKSTPKRADHRFASLLAMKLIYFFPNAQP
jgi:hypothetical protein